MHSILYRKNRPEEGSLHPTALPTAESTGSCSQLSSAAAAEAGLASPTSVDETTPTTPSPTLSQRYSNSEKRRRRSRQELTRSEPAIDEESPAEEPITGDPNNGGFSSSVDDYHSPDCNRLPPLHRRTPSYVSGLELTARGLPNGIVLFSPNGDMLSQSKQQRRASCLALPSRRGIDGGSTRSCGGNSSGGGKSTIERLASLPSKNYDPGTSLLGPTGHQRRRRQTFGPPSPPSHHSDLAITPATSGGELERQSLKSLTKEELYLMWRASEKVLNLRLKEALKQKSELQQKLASTDRLTVT